MKTLDIIIISFYLLSFIKSKCTLETETSKIRDSGDCKDRSFDEEEIENDAYRCCFLRMETDRIDYVGKEYSCVAITQQAYNDIKNYKKQLEAQIGIDKVKIDCKSSYFNYGLLSLFLLLF